MENQIPSQVLIKTNLTNFVTILITGWTHPRPMDVLNAIFTILITGWTLFSSEAFRIYRRVCLYPSLEVYCV